MATKIYVVAGLACPVAGRMESIPWPFAADIDVRSLARAIAIRQSMAGEFESGHGRLPDGTLILTVKRGRKISFLLEPPDGGPVHDGELWLTADDLEENPPSLA